MYSQKNMTFGAARETRTLHQQTRLPLKKQLIPLMKESGHTLMAMQVRFCLWFQGALWAHSEINLIKEFVAQFH